MQMAVMTDDEIASVQQLPLRALARVEEDGLAVPPQQVAVVVALRRGHLASRAEHDELSRRGLATSRSGSERRRSNCHGWFPVHLSSRPGVLSQVEDQSGRRPCPSSTSSKRVVDLLEPARLADHPGPAERVQGEHLGEVLAGADDRADDPDPLAGRSGRSAGSSGPSDSGEDRRRPAGHRAAVEAKACSNTCGDHRPSTTATSSPAERLDGPGHGVAGAGVHRPGGACFATWRASRPRRRPRRPLRRPAGRTAPAR